MLSLVAEGPKILDISSSNASSLLDYFTAQFQAEQLENLNSGANLTNLVTLVYLAQDDAAQDKIILSFTQSPEFILSTLLTGNQHTLVSKVKAIPRIIFFNGLGHLQPVMDKIQRELHAEKSSVDALLTLEEDQGVVVAFLQDHGVNEARTIYPDTLLIKQDYAALFNYLRIHAPRYLAKAFAVNEWHMVDLRVFDKYEAYELQYQRIIKAITALHLGYIVSENWEREISTFTPPLGTYKIRLLTFLEPVAFKKLLLGLEYSQDGARIVDLDLLWHNKKFSWKDVLEDSKTKQQLSEKSFLPKSIYFAVKSDKNNLIKYCVDEVNFRLSEEDRTTLANLEKDIRKH